MMDNTRKIFLKNECNNVKYSENIKERDSKRKKTFNKDATKILSTLLKERKNRFSEFGKKKLKQLFEPLKIKYNVTLGELSVIFKKRYNFFQMISFFYSHFS